MKIKTSELIDNALDWAVAEAQGISRVTEAGFYTEYANPNVTGAKPVLLPFPRCYSPSTRWAQGGPIIEREHIATSPTLDGMWSAYAPNGTRWIPRSQSGVETYHWDHKQTGPTLLIAAMRCYVASRVGDEVEVPLELLS